MPLETANFIFDLQPDWPLGTDPESQGDDHLRMIKQVLQNTLPNLDAAVTGTPDQLNSLTDGMQWTPENNDDPDNKVPGYWCSLDVDGQEDAPGQVGIHLVRSAKEGGMDMTSALAGSAAVTWFDMMNFMMPVGHVIMNTGANPATYLGFGTWTQRVGSIYGEGNVADSEGNVSGVGPGAVLGWWYVHGSHIQAFDAGGSTTTTGSHDHNYDATNTDNGHYGDTGYGGTHYTATTPAGQGNHSHETVTHVGSDNPVTYVAPGWAFYVWERTA